jgi:hypothetical protein
MKRTLLCLAPAFTLLVLSTASSSAQAIVPAFQDETNQPGYTTQDYQFTGLTLDNYPTYPSFNTSATGAWPAPIVANGGNAAETFNKVNASDYSDFLDSSPDGGGIYSFFTETQYEITQTAPLGNFTSLTLQLYMAAGSDSAATDNLYLGLPTLTLTLADSTQEVITASGLATIFSSTDATIFGMSTELDDLGFTFNLSGISEPISSYTLSWETAMHSITYGADVTEAAPEAVPEPSTLACVAIGLAAALFQWRRRRAS